MNIDENQLKISRNDSFGNDSFEKLKRDVVNKGE
jgi:hypothetical protein